MIIVIEKFWAWLFTNTLRFERIKLYAKGSENVSVATSLALRDKIALKVFLTQKEETPDHPWLHKQVLFDWRIAFCIQDAQLFGPEPEQVEHEGSQAKQLRFVMLAQRPSW